MLCFLDLLLEFSQLLLEGALGLHLAVHLGLGVAAGYDGVASGHGFLHVLDQLLLQLHQLGVTDLVGTFTRKYECNGTFILTYFSS